MKKIVIRLLITGVSLLIWIIYNNASENNSRPTTNTQNYFKNLSKSFLEGRLDIDCPPNSGCHDLVNYNNKYYLYWPPVPAWNS
mgnify:CR=1 FL=1